MWTVGRAARQDVRKEAQVLPLSIRVTVSSGPNCRWLNSCSWVASVQLRAVGPT